MIKDRVSVLIPSRRETFLSETIEDIYTNFTGDFEVIVMLDGYWPDPPIEDKHNLTLIHSSIPKGMRNAINSCVAVANGEYLLKCDAHCAFSPGINEILKAECDQDWVVIPPRYSLDAEKWGIEDNGKPRRDYHYLCYPDPFKPGDMGMHGVEWWKRCKERTDPQYDIDDEMSSQGSCWLMSKYHFDNFLHGLSEEGYGTFAQEFQEIGNKTWLGGGRVVINKKNGIWYAHLHKGSKHGRMYPQDGKEVNEGKKYSAWYWMTNQWEGRKYDFEWLIEKFWPIPTWDEHWMRDWNGTIEMWKKDFIAQKALR